MAQALMTVEQYIADVRQKDTIFIGFNSLYAKACLQLPMSEDEKLHWLSKDNVNWEKREEFLQFMAKELPYIKLTDVFDNVPLSWQLWPFLGTIAIDVEIESPEYKIINERYEDADGEPHSLDSVIYVMTLEQALSAHEKRKQLDELEYD